MVIRGERVEVYRKPGLNPKILLKLRPDVLWSGYGLARPKEFKTLKNTKLMWHKTQPLLTCTGSINDPIYRRKFFSLNLYEMCCSHYCSLVSTK